MGIFKKKKNWHANTKTSQPSWLLSPYPSFAVQRILLMGIKLETNHIYIIDYFILYTLLCHVPIQYYSIMLLWLL